jgi:hypothetical protein
MTGLFVGAYYIPVIAKFFSLEHHPGAEVSLQALALGALASAAIDLLSRSGPMRRLTGMPWSRRSADGGSPA